MKYDLNRVAVTQFGLRVNIVTAMGLWPRLWGPDSLKRPYPILKRIDNNKKVNLLTRSPTSDADRMSRVA